MKPMKKILSMCLAVMLTLSCASVAFAAEVDNATIDETAKGSLTLYKYDLTNAEKNGVWNSSYVSTGIYDDHVNQTFNKFTRDEFKGSTNSTSSLGNGQESYGYAIKGVEFTTLKIADIVQFSEPAADGSDANVEVLYAIDKTAGADFLAALALNDGAERYTDADHLDNTKYFYRSDVLIDALELALETNATVTKNAMEKYVTANGGSAMPLTDEYGKSEVKDLALGLYLVCETKCPEMVTTTCNPFMVSIPMTSVNGNNATDGGTRWIYDVTVYPKNLTGIPSLEKTLRENKEDTGKHNGSNDNIQDGYAHTGTASAGDVVDYQIVSTLPSITSEATYLTAYTFVDTLSAGLTYTKGDVVLEFFTDADCTNRIAAWKESDGKFNVTYDILEYSSSTMTIEMTEQGLTEINSSKAVYADGGMVNSGFSDCTVRITYTATVDSNYSLTTGDLGNPNEVALLWKRTSQDYYDTLVDDAHIYTYGIELTKLFSDGQGDYSNVEFIIHNDTDDYFVKAKLDKNEGNYYVTGHVNEEAEATHFIPVQLVDAPVKSSESEYRVFIRGLEDDQYTITEVRTDNGYTLLKDDITIVISQSETTELCDIYTSDVLGVIQNDPRFAESLMKGMTVKAPSQKHLEHHLLTASATVDGKNVNMQKDNGSVNAIVPLKVINTRGFDLPQTGDHGTMMFSVIGIVLMAGAVVVIMAATKKKRIVRK